MIQTHSNLLLKYLGLAIFLIAFTVTLVPLTYSQTENFEFTIETDKSEYLLGEPVTVEFELKNISLDVVNSELFPPYDRGNIEILITQIGNDPTNYISEKMTFGMDSELFIETITLNPGESTTSTEFISFNLFTDNLAFPVPAEYQIEAILIDGEDSILKSNIVNIIVTDVTGMDGDALSCLEENGLLMFLTPEAQFAPESLDPNLINKANECLANFPDSIYGDFVSSALTAIEQVSIPECPPDMIGTYPECEPNISAIPDAITDLALSAISGNRVDLSWTTPADGGSAIIGYKISRNLNGAGFTPLQKVADPTLTAFSDITLSSGDQVTYAVRAVNANGNAPPSNIPTPVTTTGDSAPDGITDLALSVISDTQVDLSWTTPADGGSAIIGYKILRNLNGAGITLLQAVADPTLTAFSDNTLSPGDKVKYVVRAVNAIGNAPPSNIPVAVRLGTFPDAITDLALTVVSGTQVDLSWTTPNNDGSPILGYHIFRNLGAGFVPLESVSDETATSFSDTTLTSGTTVTYMIRAVNADGPAAQSNIPATVSTP